MPPSSVLNPRLYLSGGSLKKKKSCLCFACVAVQVGCQLPWAPRLLTLNSLTRRRSRNLSRASRNESRRPETNTASMTTAPARWGPSAIGSSRLLKFAHVCSVWPVAAKGSVSAGPDNAHPAGEVPRNLQRQVHEVRDAEFFSKDKNFCTISAVLKKKKKGPKKCSPQRFFFLFL